MKPKVSVVVTTFNHEAYIRQAVESILAQEVGFDYEIWLGDDCSTDGTRDIVLDLQRRHPSTIRLLLPKVNQGAQGNAIFVQLLAHVTGEYVALLDGDDYWLGQEKLQRQVELLDRERHLSMCFHQALHLRMDGTTLLYSENFGYDFNRSVFTLQDILFQNFVPTCSVLFRRGLVRELPPAFVSMPSGDWFLNVLNAAHGDIGYIDEVWGVRRAHPGGVISMKSPKEKLQFNIDCIRVIDEYFESRYARQARSKLLEYHSQLLRIALDEGHQEDARRHLLRCFRLWGAPQGIRGRDVVAALWRRKGQR
jgi:glycosyltransferase involved in cell wall biosynthesis